MSKSTEQLAYALALGANPDGLIDVREPVTREDIDKAKALLDEVGPKLILDRHHD